MTNLFQLFFPATETSCNSDAVELSSSYLHQQIDGNAILMIT
ncbi:unnamed protein product, partial [Trichobilharzia regenti]